jgi:HK97 family phage major capsid protein
MKGVHHTPFSRVKSTFANITEDEARAKGYIKGNMKKEEVFSLLKRSTSPQTVYKKQKIDRDDQIDITDFDVVAWLKGEMRMMLDEEIARAVLIGDGRLASDDDKISEDHIRPIANDADLFTIKKAVTVGNDDDATATNFIRAAIKARKDYKGSGNPTLFTTEDMLTDMLLLEDGIGHALYPTEQALATKLRVSKIVTVPVMENYQVGGKDLMGIIVNMNDYNIGADKGGAVNMFDDFDIDYNQMKYLIETRCSGALVKPYSAIILFKTEVPASVDGDVKRSKTHYDEVENPTGNPAAQGWYELNETTGKYFKTTDTTVGDSKTYYVRVSYNAD